ncbi:MAG: hypothetical protein JJ863_22815 [Deltaproteobacteria bacterium]|nr:hypothetical protein [Deltaproteobacteria bacterium]
MFALALLVGCREHDLMRCHFGEEQILAETGGGHFHAVRHLGDSLLWSAREGLFVREGDAEPERLGPPCDAGLDAIADGGATFVVCARRAEPDAAKEGGLVAWRLGEERLERALPGAVGEESDGVALARHGNRLVVAWHEGAPKAFHVWRQDLDPETLEPSDEPERLSNPRFAAGAPTLYSDDEHLAVAWGEHWADHEGRHRVSGHVVVSVDGSHARMLVEVEDTHPAPVIARDAEGLLLLFRDQRAPLDYPSIFGHRLTSDFRLHGRLRLVGRADEGGPIRTFGCDIDGARTQIAVVARSWGADDTLVAAHLLDDELAERFHELQVYEWGGQLVLGDGVCDDNSLELLVAERVVPASDDARRRTAHLVTLPARCGAGPYPRSGAH